MNYDKSDLELRIYIDIFIFVDLLNVTAQC